jgi:predicted MPP superfamily phosphohydrolase
MSQHPSKSLYIGARTTTVALGTLALAGGLLASYASHVEPRWPEITRVSLSCPHLPLPLDGLTLAQISDIHFGNTIGSLETRRLVAMINALEADIIAITGDMFQRKPESAQACARELAALRAPLGVYAIMGNHERRLDPERGERPFRNAGLKVLCNAAHRIRVDGSELWMVGMDDVLVRRGDLPLALSGVPDPAFKVLLVHEPDFADEAALFQIDLQLSGHTHGGQVCLPGIGPLLLPILGRKYPMGLYRVRETWLYTNRGLGMARPAIRLNCRPEITLFTLTRGQAAPSLRSEVPPAEEEQGPTLPTVPEEVTCRRPT